MLLAGLAALLWLGVWALAGWAIFSRTATVRYPVLLPEKGDGARGALPLCSGPAIAVGDTVWRYCNYSDGAVRGFVRFSLADGEAMEAWPVEIGKSQVLGFAPSDTGDVALIVPTNGLILRLSNDGGVAVIGQLPSKDRLLGLAWRDGNLEVVQGRRGNLLFLSYDGVKHPSTRRLVLPWRTTYGLCTPAVAQFADSRWTTWLTCEDADRADGAKLSVAMVLLDDAGVEIDARIVEMASRPSVSTIDLAVDRSGGNVARWHPFRFLLVQRGAEWLVKTATGGTDRGVERDYVAASTKLATLSRTPRKGGELRVSLPDGPVDMVTADGSILLRQADGSGSGNATDDALLLKTPRLLPRTAGGLWLLADDGLWGAAHSNLAPANALGPGERILRVNRHFEQRSSDEFFRKHPTLKRVVLLLLFFLWPLLYVSFLLARRKLGPVLRPACLTGAAGIYVVLFLAGLKWLWFVLGAI